VTVVVANPNGKDSLAGTLSATTLQNETNTVSFATSPGKNVTTLSISLTATLKTFPCGTASVTTQRPSVVHSSTVRFGPC